MISAGGSQRLDEGEEQLDIVHGGPKVREAGAKPHLAIDRRGRHVDTSICLESDAQFGVMGVVVTAPRNDAADRDDGQCRG